MGSRLSSCLSGSILSETDGKSDLQDSLMDEQRGSIDRKLEYGQDNSDEDEEILSGVSNSVFRQDPVESVYHICDVVLGKGATGDIRVVVDKQTNDKFAMKTMNLSGLSPSQRERILKESQILSRLHHPNIVKLYEVYENGDFLYLIFELLSGGELFRKLVKSPSGCFTEEYTRFIMHDIVNAVKYLHDSKNIAHRDIKLSNIMFADKTPESSIKLIDFGLSRTFARHDYAHTLVGTRNYIAPEVYSEKNRFAGYTKSCDMWSIGIIAYYMLTGRHPLPPQPGEPGDDYEFPPIPFPRKYWSHLSHDAKDFTSKLLVYDPNERMTASQAQEHPWFQQYILPRRLGSSAHSFTHSVSDHKSGSDGELSPSPVDIITPKVLGYMQMYQGMNKLKKAALTAVAYHMNALYLSKLEQAFEYFDATHSGTICFDEFRDAINHIRTLQSCTANWTHFEFTSDESKLKQLFDGIDYDNKGYIDYSEFMAACLARKEGLKKEYAELIFDLIDRNHLGYILLSDFHKFFGKEVAMEEIEAIVFATFGSLKNKLTEEDLVRIMNTEMMTCNNTEAAVTRVVGTHINSPDTEYLAITSVFNRLPSDGQLLSGGSCTCPSVVKEVEMGESKGDDARSVGDGVSRLLVPEAPAHTHDTMPSSATHPQQSLGKHEGDDDDDVDDEMHQRDGPVPPSAEQHIIVDQLPNALEDVVANEDATQTKTRSVDQNPVDSAVEGSPITPADTVSTELSALDPSHVLSSSPNHELRSASSSSDGSKEIPMFHELGNPKSNNSHDLLQPNRSSLSSHDAYSELLVRSLAVYASDSISGSFYKQP